MKTNTPLPRLAAGFFLSVALSVSAPLEDGQTLEVLHTFEGPDGVRPKCALVQGKDGNFYGTTPHGGDLSVNNGDGFGTVFKMTPDGALTTIALFNQTNGSK
jgi:uncharacterized repeat protein (TIGR03803 family)